MKRITIKEVANETGLSIATISYVLNGKGNIPDETRQLVTDAAQKLGYIPNYSARSLVIRKSNLIGIVIPQAEPGSALMFQNPFYSEILSGIEFTARQNGYHVIISGTNADEKYLKLAQQRNLDGIIIIGMYSHESYADLTKADIPLVLIDSYVDNHHFHTIKINDRYGGYLATRYLIEHGHRKIAFISGALKESSVNKQRLEGYYDALQEYDIAPDNRYILVEQVNFDSGMHLAEKLIKTLDVTAVFCTADILALGVIKQLNMKEYLVPERISVIGFDNLSIARYCVPGLTTVGQDVYKKGAEAVNIVLNYIKNPEIGKQEISLPVSIVERESVKSII
ncbi:MAG: LacI family DNA-binding transcriptional regulator [Bacillota bacterium]